MCGGKKNDSFISLLQMLALHFIKLSPVKYIPPTQAKAHRGQKPVKPLIEIAILSDKISPRHRFTNRVIICLGQVRCLFILAPLAYNDAVFILLCLEDKMASQRCSNLQAAAGKSCQKQQSMRERENTHSAATVCHELRYYIVY